MIVSTILNSCNTILAYIGGTIQTKHLAPNGIMFSLMVVLIRSNLQNLGNLYIDYINMIGGCKMMWNFFGSRHGKGLHDGA
jgi:hypothetical protein